MKQHVVAFLHSKGGTGKSTLITNMGHALKNYGTVLIIDADPQASTRDWHAAGEGKILNVVGCDVPTLEKDVQSLKKFYDFILIDGARRNPDAKFNLEVAAIKAADTILIPIQASSFDIWAVYELVDLIKSRQQILNGRPKVSFILNRNEKNTRLSRDVKEVLDHFSIPVFNTRVENRVAYVMCLTSGDTVISFKDNVAKDAAYEIFSLTEEFLRFIS